MVCIQTTAIWLAVCQIRKSLFDQLQSLGSLSAIVIHSKPQSVPSLTGRLFRTELLYRLLLLRELNWIGFCSKPAHFIYLDWRHHVPDIVLPLYNQDSSPISWINAILSGWVWERKSALLVTLYIYEIYISISGLKHALSTSGPTRLPHTHHHLLAWVICFMGIFDCHYTVISLDITE